MVLRVNLLKRILENLILSLLNYYKCTYRFCYSQFRTFALHTDPSNTSLVSLTKELLTDNERSGFDFGEEA